jgi:hypothetical protein
MAKEIKKEIKNKPVAQFRAGQVTASIWATEKELNKKKVTFYNVTIVKNYMDDETEEWKQTSSFNREDLVKVALVTQKAIDYIYTSKKEDTEEE